MRVQTWSHSDVPADRTVIDYIKEHCDWEGAVANVGAQYLPKLSVPNLTVDPEALLKEIYELYREVGAVPWQSQSNLNLYGLSLHYNPDHAQDEWKQASFGHPRYRKHSTYDYFKAVSADHENRVKGDYLDSLGFAKPLPAIAQKEALSSLFARFKLPVVRVTARTINGSLTYPTIPGDGGLHTDDPPFEVLRINLCLSNNGDFGLQYLDEPPIFSKAGENLVVNTDIKHRAFLKQHNDYLRTNLIIGVTPWLNYDKERDEWSLNEYFGRLHPYDIINQELLI